MDPIVCLELCDAAIASGELDDAREHLANYRRWRAMGGFEPELGELVGDHFANFCARHIFDQEVEA